MSQLNIFSTIVLSLFVILSIDCIDSRRQLSRNDRQELEKFKLTVKLLDGVLNDNDNNPDAGTGGGQGGGGGGGGTSNRNLPTVSSGIGAVDEKDIEYYDTNGKQINKQEYLRLKQEWDRQQQQPNGGSGVSNSGTTVPVGPPIQRWGSLSPLIMRTMELNYIMYSNGTKHIIPNKPIYTYLDPKHNRITREQWQQFNTDNEENWFKNNLIIKTNLKKSIKI
ncbi:uncharacterized protein LOC128956996 [Oppia nitens]|uniref:uncharacterized protein LOC128956996 n=1 Tax=Oppia nitens TaxID=1686743 RepID=UPI0023DC54FA|nr:uncharacterized protein LOC128956996 [Oppia nitens]